MIAAHPQHGHIAREGLQLWRQQQQLERQRKLTEQREMREMLDKYWPFERANEAKPRGLRNLRLDGLFPDGDYRNAKRFVGTLDLGRPGGGAPMLTDAGKTLTRTRLDPLLRFQFGNGDLRRCVDNTLRYKTDKMEQQQYKKELDKLVDEKNKLKAKIRQEDEKYDHDRGTSDEKTVKQLGDDEAAAKPSARKSHHTPEVRKSKKIEPVFYPCKNVQFASKPRRLSPLPNSKGYGVELVPILAKQRNFPTKIHLDSTDITNEKKISKNSNLWSRQGSAYLRELTQQVNHKEQTLKNMKAEEKETVQRHFTTWESFWGRPGHGAPRSAIRKQRLDRLLYPQMMPIGVH